MGRILCIHFEIKVSILSVHPSVKGNLKVLDVLLKIFFCTVLLTD